MSVLYPHNTTCMSEIKQLKPQSVWENFYEITRVPRPSKREEKIIQYLLDFGKKHGIETKRDAAGNVLMRKPATPGMENRKPIVLQSHVDMVCEKNADVKHDFLTDPIRTYVDGDWVRAQGTTLGADDGIGVAAQLAVLTDPSVKHGPVECLFTVDEETGLTGAFALEAGFFEGEILLNLDSEDEGEIFIGCAGGEDTTATFSYTTVGCPADCRAFRLSVTGLKGGHSGDDIQKGLGNSIKLLARTLHYLAEKLPIHLFGIEGGNLRNAIAREAFANFAIAKGRVEELTARVGEMRDWLKNEFRTTEPDLKIELLPTDASSVVMEKEPQGRLINLLLALPHGAIEFSREIPGLVETSTNLASIKKIEGNRLFIATSQRSSVDSAKDYICASVAACFRLAGCTVEHSDGYPGWAPNPESPILDVTVEAYRRLFCTRPVVRAIHAGLECGLFLEKYPRLDMVSFGPTIRGAHSPEERISIETVQKFWELLLAVLENAPLA